MSTYFKLGNLVEGTDSTATSGGTLALSVSSKTFQRLTGTANHTVTLPDATTLKIGRRFSIKNRSTGTVTVNAFGGSLVASLAANTQRDFVVSDVSTAAGMWELAGDSGSSGGGQASVSSEDSLKLLQGVAAFNYDDGSIVSKQVKFNPEDMSADAWISRFPLSTAVYGPNNFVLNGFAYSPGGNNGSGAVTNNPRYDSTNNYWVSRATITVSKSQGVGFTLGGKGYVSNGYTGTSTAVATTYQYSDDTDSWATKASSNNAHSTLESEGIVLSGFGYVVAGSVSGSASAINELYDPTADAFRIRAPLPAARNQPGFFHLNNFGYVAGGENAGNQSNTYKYNDVSNTWTVVASLSVARDGCASGHTGYSGIVTSSAAFNNVEEYIDFANYYRSKPTLISARSHAACSSIDATVYSTGGFDGAASATVQQYKNGNFIYLGSMLRSSAAPSVVRLATVIKGLSSKVLAQIRTDSNTWKTFEANEDGVAKFDETLSDKFIENGLLYLAGGSNAATTTSYADVEAYNPELDNWMTRTSLSAARAHPHCFGLDGFGFAAGGFGPTNGPSIDTVERYNEIANTHTNRAVMTTPQGMCGGVNIRGFGYSFGGVQSNSVANSTGNTSNYQYNNTTNAWSTKTSIPQGFAQTNPCTMHERGFISSGSPDNSGTTQSAGYYYDAITNAWTSIASAPNSDRQLINFSVNNFMYRNAGVSVSTTATHKYDPNTNAWTSSVASSNAPHTNAGASSVYGFGWALNNDSVTASIERFNSANNVWENKGSSILGRREPGSNYTPGVYRNYEIRVAPPAYVAGVGAGVWVNRASIGIASSGSQGFSLGDSGYIVGLSNDTRTARYNPYTDVFVQNASTANNKSRAGTFSLAGFGFVTGSANSSATASEKYDPFANAWSSITSTSSNHDEGSDFALNGFGYACGQSVSGSTVERYNQATNAWSAAGSLAANVSALTGGSAAINGFGFTLGGNTTNNTQKYNDASNVWATVASYVSNVNLVGLVMSKDKLHAAGGHNGTSSIATSATYRDAANVWITVNSMATARYAPPSFVVGKIRMATSGNEALTSTEAYIESLNDLVMGVALEVE